MFGQRWNRKCTPQDFIQSLQHCNKEEKKRTETDGVPLIYSWPFEAEATPRPLGKWKTADATHRVLPQQH
jgi:hypothetical protein